MKTKILSIILLFALSFIAHAREDNTCLQVNSNVQPQGQVAQRGCCSWHNGVCGCSGGRATCCDGSYSPSCSCHADDPTSLKPYSSEEPKS